MFVQSSRRGQGLRFDGLDAVDRRFAFDGHSAPARSAVDQRGMDTPTCDAAEPAAKRPCDLVCKNCCPVVQVATVAHFHAAGSVVHQEVTLPGRNAVFRHGLSLHAPTPAATIGDICRITSTFCAARRLFIRAALARSPPAEPPGAGKVVSLRGPSNSCLGRGRTRAPGRREETRGRRLLERGMKPS